GQSAIGVEDAGRRQGDRVPKGTRAKRVATGGGQVPVHPPARQGALSLSATPNILILMADQLTARALPAYGNRVAKTPHIDALADRGVEVGSFYCNRPLCAP